MSTEYYECKRLSWDFKKKLSEKYFFQKHFGKILFSKIFWKNIFFKNIFQKYFFQKYFSKIFFWKKYLFRNFLKKGGGGGVIQPNWGSGLNEDLVNISSLHNMWDSIFWSCIPPPELRPSGKFLLVTLGPSGKFLVVTLGPSGKFLVVTSPPSTGGVCRTKKLNPT